MRSSSRPPINMAWLWCSPAYATSGIRLGSQEIEHLDERSLAAVVQRSISWGAMKVLIVGAGGREHALAWKCAASPRVTRDRKSTRLNSSHSQISYAVFCLKKKKKQQKHSTY